MVAVDCVVETDGVDSGELDASVVVSETVLIDVPSVACSDVDVLNMSTEVVEAPDVVDCTTGVVLAVDCVDETDGVDSIELDASVVVSGTVLIDVPSVACSDVDVLNMSTEIVEAPDVVD